MCSRLKIGVNLGITLATTDAKDGGTVNYSVTLSGYAFSVNVVIYYTAFSGEKVSNITQVASFSSGAGTVTGSFTLPKGSYLLYAKAFNYANSVADTSGICCLQVTDQGNPLETPHYVIMTAIKNLILNLGFTGLTTGRVEIKRVPRFLSIQQAESLPLPFCFICALGVEEYDNKVMDRDDVGFPTLITFVDRSNQSNVEDGKLLSWRHLAMQKLRHPRLVGAPTVIKSAILPDAILIPEAFTHNLAVSAFACRHFVRETRG